MDSKKAQQILDDCLKRHQGLAEQLKDVEIGRAHV